MSFDRKAYMREYMRKAYKAGKPYARKADERKKKMLADLLAIKAKSGCVDCGINDPVVLDFDHRNPEEKSETISTMITRGRAWKAIEAEVAKCVVRCANCHRRVTAKYFNYYSLVV